MKLSGKGTLINLKRSTSDTKLTRRTAVVLAPLTIIGRRLVAAPCIWRAVWVATAARSAAGGSSVIVFGEFGEGEELFGVILTSKQVLFEFERAKPG